MTDQSDIADGSAIGNRRVLRTHWYNGSLFHSIHDSLEDAIESEIRMVDNEAGATGSLYWEATTSEETRLVTPDESSPVWSRIQREKWAERAEGIKDQPKRRRIEFRPPDDKDQRLFVWCTDEELAAKKADLATFGFTTRFGR